VICDVETLEVKLAIELDDSSHRRSDRIARDRFLNNAFASAGLPLLRVAVEERYETAALRRMIEDALGIARSKKKKW
jgi:very-short-patch-repair endonuclease